MRYKEKMEPGKKMQKPAKRVAQKKYDAAKEEYDDKMFKKAVIGRKPTGVAEAFEMAKEGYSKKPRVKPSKKR